ncbi:MAG: hypothetical protein ACLPV4_19505 [Solirubrobacteraceae bacterium]
MEPRQTALDGGASAIRHLGAVVQERVRSKFAGVDPVAHGLRVQVRQLGELSDSKELAGRHDPRPIRIVLGDRERERAHEHMFA